MSSLVCVFGEVSSLQEFFCLQNQGMTQHEVDWAVQTLIFREAPGEGTEAEKTSYYSFSSLSSLWPLKFSLANTGTLKGPVLPGWSS